MRRTLAEWVADSHGVAVEKGWWPEPKDLSPESILAKLMLVNSELAEAVELVREPSFDPRAVWFVGAGGGRVPYAEVRPDVPKIPKPEGFGTELADAAIRIFDLAGALGLEPPANRTLEIDRPPRADLRADAILAMLMRASVLLGKSADVAEVPRHLWKRIDAEEFSGNLFSAVDFLIGLSGWCGVDLDARVVEKQAFNKTRPARHGGKRA